MSLKVHVRKGNNLPNVEKFGKSDPFVVLRFKGKKEKTEYIDNNLDPEWNETIEYSLDEALATTDNLEVEVFDHERVGSHRLLGKTQIALNKLVKEKKVSSTYSLTAKDGSNTKATVQLELEYEPPEGDATTGEVGATQGSQPTETLSGLSGDSELSQKRARDSLPNRPIDFQLRFHVLEARRLSGSNLKPVVSVFVGDKHQQTKPQIGTSSPYWNETFVFNFMEKPQEMFEKIIDVRLYDSKGLFKDSLIGSFKFDAGLVYDEPQHSIVHKWLLMTDPQDPASEAKGYLKISVNVLGPGDVAVASPSEMDDENVDIEANLLRPSGVRLQASTITVKIYQAEDLPQMDLAFLKSITSLLGSKSKKEQVDPYCTVSFAGHIEKTPILKSTVNPVWNSQINLAVRLPSMCDKLRICVKDYDKLSKDDFVGTIVLNMSEISVPGENGFLPTFGPSYLNMYGSPRELTVLNKYDYLDKGKAEGVAYRGRILAELSVDVGNLPSNTVESISEADKDLIAPYMRRQCYKLYAAFMHATMINPANQPVEFEVSIGNYGNKLDKSIPATSSSTPPLVPVIDGTYYHYLPWFNAKPCVVVESYWEDNAYRIGTLNILLSVCKELKNGLDECKSIVAKKVYHMKELSEKVAKVLADAIAVLQQSLPELPKHGLTQLDINLRKYREEERISLVNAIDKLISRVKIPLPVIEELDNILCSLQNIAKDPQISVPDVIIWMLSGNERVAYKRIPAHQLMYSEYHMSCGELCGKIQTITLNPPQPENEGSTRIGKGHAQLRLLLWLGLEKHAPKWSENITEGNVAVFAETYENQAWFLGKWGTTGLLRPQFSDIKGRSKLFKELFSTPSGWEWEGEWFISPETSHASKLSSSGQVGQDEIFEYQFREPYTSFDTATSLWRNCDNEPLGEGITRETFNLPKGWEWLSEWTYDLNRAVNEDGWEYATDVQDGVWCPAEKTIHACRRKRWIRMRKCIEEPEQVESALWSPEGWEYAKLPHMTYHPEDHPLNMARRRRWHRKLIQVKGGKIPVFYFRSNEEKKKTKKKKKEKEEDDSSSDEESMQAPRMCLVYPEEMAHRYQLRVYLYQARDLYASDESGLSDPYVYVSFGRYTQRSIIMKQTVSPLWEQTLIFDNMVMYGNPATLQKFPPVVVLDLFDKDILGKDEFLGRCSCVPCFSLEPSPETSPTLKWYSLIRYNREAGEVLAAFELFLLNGGTELPPLPSRKKENYFQIPTGIAPILQKHRIEVLCWGVREMKRYQLLPVNNPIVEIECAGIIVQTLPMKNAKENPNFQDPVVSMDVNIPKEAIYAPSLNIRILDKRAFGRKPVVGVFSVKSLEDYHVDPLKESIAIAAAATAMSTASSRQSIRPVPQSGRSTRALSCEVFEETTEEVATVTSVSDEGLAPKDPDVHKSSDFDWWSKFYSSLKNDSRKQPEYLEAGYDKLMVYDNSLETFFDNFEDLVTTFPLFLGKGDHSREETTMDDVGKLKGAIKICPFYEDGSEPPHVFGNVPSTSPEECVIRVYVVRAIGLQPQDNNGKSDPYIKVEIGKSCIKDKDNYIPNSVNPIFGKMYELTTVLPLNNNLKVTVMDHDVLSADDEIGETVIDLENRYLTRHRAICGIPESYSSSGMNRWRDSQMPSDILKEHCTLKGFPDPNWISNQEIAIGRKIFNLSQFEPNGPPHADVGDEKERLALHIVKSYGLVPEHVETRPLYCRTHPGIEQGRLQLWVDIFPKSLGAPPPSVDISPRKPKKYFLRVIIWNTQDVVLDEVSIVTGEAMSDIYLKGWLQGENETQKTDVHFRSMDGTGNFNWRLVFPFEYIPQEGVMVLKGKEHFFSLDETEQLLPPKFTIQVWDNDLFNPDDFIGTLDLKLDQVPLPKKSASKCDLDMLPDWSSEAVVANLFKQKRMNGWWPLYSDKQGRDNREVMGKVEMELEILTEEEEQLKPAGVGREDPNTNPFLPEPNRPATSFLWITSPWRTLKFIIWKHYKFHIIGAIFLVVFILLLVVFIYTLPSTIGQWMLGGLLPSVT